MKAYSPDLCAKIARAYDEGAGSQRQLSRQFRVSLTFIQKMRRRLRVTGEPAATRHPGGRQPLLDSDSLLLIGQLIQEQNDLTLSELGERVSHERGVRVSVPTMYQAVRRLGLPHKKSWSMPQSAIPREFRPSASLTARRPVSSPSSG